MTSLGRVVVGYRKQDRRRYLLEREQGLSSVETTTCAAGCGYPVFFVRSGYDAARFRDAEVICDDCYQRYKPEIQEAL